MSCNGPLVCCSVFLVILLALTKDVNGQQIRSHPSPDFSEHSRATPRVLHARTRRSLDSTKDDSGLHHDQLTLELDVEDQRYVLDLRLQRELVAGGHVVQYQQNGRAVEYTPSVEELNICQYQGSVRGRPRSWAAVSTCRGVRGAIYDGEDMLYIEPGDANALDAPHYVYAGRALTAATPCGYGGVTPNAGYDPPLYEEHRRRGAAAATRGARHKRSPDSDADTDIFGPYNENRRSRYLELVLVADRAEYEASGRDLDAVHHQLKDLANIINSLYVSLNVFVALTGAVVWTERDAIQLSEDGDETLSHFLHYRRRELLPTLPNDSAQLITRQKFTGGVVGKALKGPICTYQFSGGVSTNHSTVLGLLAATIAHELGHSFGMEHDTEEDCKCPDAQCIMSPSSTSYMPMHWSTCSLKSLALAFERGMDYCLRNKPKSLFDSPTCGNGFVEPGEQCDCGLAPAAACAACCAPDCRLRRNATCAAGQCCDLQTCRPKPEGTLCRGAARECDLPEYCSGRSERCPRDLAKMDATPCGGQDPAYCVGGSCRSHSAQCRLLWGSTGQMSHPHCYQQINMRKDANGNCGYDRVKETYIPCAAGSGLCGRLQCRHLNEQLEFGMETVAVLTHSFLTNHDKVEPCRGATIDLGLQQTDPGLVPDGARCGDDMMCLSQRCVPVASVRERARLAPGSVCPSNCSGHGVCNSEGQCHCDAGFGPPLCAGPGPGGSYGSGPASDSRVQRNFMVTMYIIFLGVIPSLVLAVLLVHYSKHNVLCARRPTKTVQSPKKSSLQRRISKSASKFASTFHHGPSSGAAAVTANALSPPDEMSSSLLRGDSSPAVNPTVNFFGNFEGFSLKPIDKTPKEPAGKSAKITPVHRGTSNSSSFTAKPALRAAPPLPVVPQPSSPKTSPSVQRTNSTVQNKIRAFMTADKEDATADPPARPVISSPILEASTCTAKELISPLQGSKTLGPVRAAPQAPPAAAPRPLSLHAASNVLQKPLPDEPKNKGLSLTRIASFLKHDRPKDKERSPVERSHSLPKNNQQARPLRHVDKAALRTLQISHPIPQREIEPPAGSVPVVSDAEDDDRTLVSRTQSLRGAPVTAKPVIQSFGSMRQAGAGRPTAPPPPRPEASIYQNPKPVSELRSVDYVDCIEDKPAPLAHIDEESADNIYAIIEESPEKQPAPLRTAPREPPAGAAPRGTGSAESLGLLGEIASEIQNRNYDSIYSASTLTRKKNKDGRDSTYVNAEYRTPESVYSGSTTSSGYLLPSAVNVPPRPSEAKAEEEKPPLSPTMKANSKIPTFARQVTPPNLNRQATPPNLNAQVTPPNLNRQVTPPNLNAQVTPPNLNRQVTPPNLNRQVTPPNLNRQVTPPNLNRQATPPNLTRQAAGLARQVTPPGLKTFKTVPSSPKVSSRTDIVPNSPDVVSSCALPDVTAAKPPDVVNNNSKPNADPPKVAVKPSLLKDSPRPPVKPAARAGKAVSAAKPERPLSRVASKVDSNVKAIADSLNKNKPKAVPKPAVTPEPVKPAVKLTSKPSNVASLQQKFENRKSFTREAVNGKK